MSESPFLCAHHGNAQYDDRHQIPVSGIVTEFVWANPHSQIYLDVKDGWSDRSLKAGDQITITLDPAKNGDPVGWSGAAGRHSVIVANGPILTFDKSQD